MTLVDFLGFFCSGNKRRGMSSSCDITGVCVTGLGSGTAAITVGVATLLDNVIEGDKERVLLGLQLRDTEEQILEQGNEPNTIGKEVEKETTVDEESSLISLMSD